MKVTLDLTKLLHEGKITQAEFDKIAALAARETGALAINILMGFGVVAVALGALALAPTELTAFALGAVLAAAGLALLFMQDERWRILANICLLVGALMLGGGIVKLGEGSAASFLVVAILFASAGVLTQSGLLIAGAVLALSSCIGVRTGYLHATYFLGIQEPTITIVLFSLVALATFLVSKQVAPPYDRLAIAAARTAVFLVNFGFWIGSLWGDRLVWLRSMADPAVLDRSAPALIGREVFVIGWAAALIAVGLWAMQANRRWVVNIVAVFGAIHFYTQWFERLGPNPLSILVGGLLVLAFAAGLWQFNRRLERPAS